MHAMFKTQQYACNVQDTTICMQCSRHNNMHAVFNMLFRFLLHSFLIYHDM